MSNYAPVHTKDDTLSPSLSPQQHHHEPLAIEVSSLRSPVDEETGMNSNFTDSEIDAQLPLRSNTSGLTIPSGKLSTNSRLTQRISPSSTPAGDRTPLIATSSGAQFKRHPSSSPPQHYPLAGVSSPMSVNVAGWVVTFLLFTLALLVILDIAYPGSVTSSRSIGSVAIPGPITVSQQSTHKSISQEVIPDVISTRPVNRPTMQGWTDRATDIHSDLVRRGSTATIAFIGDSLTQQFIDERVGARVWNSTYADPPVSTTTSTSSSATPQRRVVNLGSSGDQTQHVLWRLDKNANVNDVTTNELALLNPNTLEVVVLLIGTNNAAYGQSATDILYGIRAILKLLNARLPTTQIVVLTLLPRSDVLDRFLRNQQVNTELMNWDYRTDSIYVYDINQHFTLEHTHLSYDQQSIPELDLQRIASDKLHLTEEGYRAFARALEPLLQKHEGQARIVKEKEKEKTR